jgi:hypothetical protein
MLQMPALISSFLICSAIYESISEFLFLILFMVHVPLHLLSICSYHLGFMNRCSQLKDEWMPNQAMAVLLTSQSLLLSVIKHLMAKILNC